MKAVKQIFQDLKNGETLILDIPKPANKKGHILIRTSKSLISTGTERMLVDFGKANMLQKARSQPEKVKQVINKVKTDGILETIDAVTTKLNQPIPLGYSNVGIIEEIGPDLKVSEFKVGDRVLSNGFHSEIVSVPKNLCIPIPDEVSDDEAIFTVLASIALQGIRLANPTIGETFAVFGLGLIGLLTVQILKANGCQVIGIDYNQHRLDLAKESGAFIVNLSDNQDLIEFTKSLTEEAGVDGALITAATDSSEPVSMSAKICRKRGRVVLIGVCGLDLNRDDFYKKEISFQVSCSYGPGRYDPTYEKQGIDYPYGFVRWTEKRNFKAVLTLMQNRKINISKYITHRFSLDKAETAYQMISDNKESYLGIAIEYKNKRSETDKFTSTITLSRNKIKQISGQPIIGVIGAGNFTGRILLKALKNTPAILKTIVSQNGINASHLGKKFSFNEASTDINKIFNDNEINTVFITTRHDTHCDLIIKSLESGKHVFVEKPLCLNNTELKQIEALYQKIEDDPSKNTPLLMIGFNRRFSPFTLKIKELIKDRVSALSFIMTINAGFIPSDHWIQNIDIGGGRIIGEACHFIDLLRYLSNSKIKTVQMINLNDNKYSDSTIISLQFEDGSIGAINYLSNGSKAFPKEKLTIFCDEKILELDNFRSLKGYGFKNFNQLKRLKIDKGHQNEITAFVNAIKNGDKSPISFEEIIEVTKVSFSK